MNKKILFISPANQINISRNSKALALPPLGLLYIATVTPDQYDVKIIDEAWDTIDFEEKVDLVAISCLSFTANRSYEISQQFRKRNIPVVMGGIHPSVMPDEASKYADTIIVGEADEIWLEFLKDFENNEMQERYTVTKRPDLSKIPPLKRHLLSNKYSLDVVQTTRGCPHNCRFCSVTHFNGGKYRFRNLDDVVEEIKQIKGKNILIVDDNVIGHTKIAHDRAMELFKRLKGLNKNFIAQATISIADHPDLLKAAVDAGCNMFLIGFESINPDSLGHMDKRVNLREGDPVAYYEASIKKIHEHKISIIGSFMFGGDNETLETIDTTCDFVIKNNINAVQFCVLSPLPGTKLYEELKDANRLTKTNYPEDWDAYNVFVVLFDLKNMDEDEFYRRLFLAYKRISGFRISLKRAIYTFKTTKKGFNAGMSFFYNKGIYKTLRSVPHFKKYLP